MAGDLEFDWDRANVEHIALHRVGLDEVEEIFENDECNIDYDVIGGEERWTALGETNAGRVLIVVFTLRAEQIRVVTAFEASHTVRVQYLKMKGQR